MSVKKIRVCRINSNFISNIKINKITIQQTLSTNEIISIKILLLDGDIYCREISENISF